ncbi:hypothetical protein AWC38_SpisGene8435 [Stylophora pistillata]|uniref:Uncharacterized protein n=1 Tax=Stylophora pistillata TaxID=50429 RepID=A0A2B4SCU2_STYPI|nr:hypothetical protein AWC38_SpisGene8435 [Stylophora pistillata]
MSVIQSPKFFKLLSWIAIVATTVVELVPLNRHGRVSTVRSRPSERAIKDLPSSGNLGNSDITKLLDDLDNQTEAIRSGQEIGEELLGGKNQTGLRENELERSNGTILDNSSQAVSTAGAPVLVDRDGVPEKTTALENGASYLAGKPLLIFNNKSKDLDVSKWFLYYPLTTETDEQRA